MEFPAEGVPTPAPADHALYVNVAKICHEMNRTLCAQLGDHSQVSWEDAPSWQKASAVDGVRAVAEGRVRTPNQSHAAWLERKLREGWTYGEVKDVENKVHPCMLPYECLPDSEKLKDITFINIAAAFTVEGCL
jgi:hypothetical protein